MWFGCKSDIPLVTTKFLCEILHEFKKMSANLTFSAVSPKVFELLRHAIPQIKDVKELFEPCLCHCTI